MSLIVLPGDEIKPQEVSGKKQIRIGPGLRHIYPSTIESTVAGSLVNDTKKKATWVEFDNGRYIPAVGDLVIATMHHSSTDFYHCQLSAHAPLVLLPQLAFEAASKKTRPNLTHGALIYARVASVSRHTDTELECVKPETGKAGGLGPLKGGMVYNVSLSFARRLMLGQAGGVVVLEEFSQTLSFEVAIGRNGKVWIDAGENIVATIVIGKVLTDVDEKKMDIVAQKDLVKKALKAIT